jgi:hypothetical protein
VHLDQANSECVWVRHWYQRLPKSPELPKVRIEDPLEQQVSISAILAVLAILAIAKHLKNIK